MKRACAVLWGLLVLSLSSPSWATPIDSFYCHDSANTNLVYGYLYQNTGDSQSLMLMFVENGVQKTIDNIYDPSSGAALIENPTFFNNDPAQLQSLGFAYNGVIYVFKRNNMETGGDIQAEVDVGIYPHIQPVSVSGCSYN